MVIKSIIGKVKSITNKSDAPESEFIIKEVEPIDDIVADFFNDIENGGAE